LCSGPYSSISFLTSSYRVAVDINQDVMRIYFFLFQVIISQTLIFPPTAQQPLVGQGVIIIETSRSHPDTPQFVGLLWTSDEPDVQTLPDTTQHSQEEGVHASGGIRTHKPSKRKAADPHLRLLGHWDRHKHTWCSHKLLATNLGKKQRMYKRMIIKVVTWQIDAKYAYSFKTTENSCCCLLSC
jgi:hypothetical protein